MQHRAIEGIYRGGKVELPEAPADIDEARVIVTFLPDETAPTWQDTLAELSSLAENWDGYGSPPLQGAAFKEAFRLLNAVEQEDLPTPHLCPVTGGGLGIEWQVGSRELEIEVMPDGTIEYTAAENGDIREGSLSLPNSDELKRLTAWLATG